MNLWCLLILKVKIFLNFNFCLKIFFVIFLIDVVFVFWEILMVIIFFERINLLLFLILVDFEWL